MADETTAPPAHEPLRTFPAQMVYLREQHIATTQALAAVDAFTPIDAIARMLGEMAALNYLIGDGKDQQQAERAERRREAQALQVSGTERDAAHDAMVKTYDRRKAVQTRQARIAEIDWTLTLDPPPLPAAFKAAGMRQYARTLDPSAMDQAHADYKHHLRRERAQIEREIVTLESGGTV